MATDRLSIPIGPSFSASQLAALQSPARLSTASAPDGRAEQQMAPAKLTLPARSKSFDASTDGAQKRFFEEDLRRSTIMERLASSESPEDFADDVDSSFSTVFERLSSVDSSTIDLASDHPEETAVKPGVKTLADRLGDLKAKGLKLDELAKNIEKAKSVNVDPAKRTFWQKFGGTAVSLGVVIFFTALTLSTGGIAAIVGLSAASMMLAKNSGDTYCAMKVLQNKKAQIRGEDPPHTNVPMGADSIGNMCHSALAKLNKQKIADGEMSPDALKAKAKSWSLGINTALKVVSFSASGVVGIASGADWLPRIGSIAFSAATLALTITLDKLKQGNEEMAKLYADEKMPTRMLQLSHEYLQILENANDLPQDQQDQLFAKLNLGLSALDMDLEKLETRLLKTQEKLENPSNLTGQVVKGALTEGALLPGGVQVSRRALEIIPIVKSTGMNLESIASSILLFKTAFDCLGMLNGLNEGIDALHVHADTILDLRNDIAQFV
jgi:hypothetical protein